MQPRPDQLQMMVELSAPSVSVPTLNAMLMKAKIVCKGPKVQKAKCLVEKLPVHELQKLLAEAMNPPADPAANDTRSSTAAALAADNDARVDDTPVPVMEIAAKASDPAVDAATTSAFHETASNASPREQPEPSVPASIVGAAVETSAK